MIRKPGAAIREIRNEFVSGGRSKFVKFVKFVVIKRICVLEKVESDDKIAAVLLHVDSFMG